MNFIIAVVIMITTMIFCQWLFAKIFKRDKKNEEMFI